MADDDLDQLLPLIDEPSLTDDELAHAEARVWRRLVGGSDGSQPGAVTGPGRAQRRRWVPIVTVAAAVALVVVGLAALLVLRDGGTAPDQTAAGDVEDRGDLAPDPTLVRGNACARYTAAADDLAVLDELLAEDPGVAARELEVAVAALRRLEDDLAAAGAPPAELDALALIRGGVNQAALQATDGDVGSALVSLEFANRVYGESGLAADACLG